jgi:hypothetical protein
VGLKTHNGIKFSFFNEPTTLEQIVSFYLKEVVTLKKLLNIFLILVSLVACAGMHSMTPMQVSNEVSRINMELPRRINDNTTLERVSHDGFKSVLVCHYTVERWDGANVVAREQSKHLFCEKMEQKYRDYLFSMADTIEFEYRMPDGWMQYVFVAEKDMCK